MRFLRWGIAAFGLPLMAALAFAQGVPDAALGTGDFNGDGFSDVLFKNASGQAVLWFMYGDIHTGTKTITKPGAGFNLTGSADVDGNGYSDLLWSDASTNVTATNLGGPSSLVSTTVLGNSVLATPGATYQLMDSTGGG
jgi:hypothetical protein